VTSASLDMPTKVGEHPLARHWRALDRIYCISLSNRPDRIQHARLQFQRVGLANLVEFVVVDKHPTNSELGIFQSHMGCLRAGLDAGAQQIAIFEDDILFKRFSPDRLKRALRFMESGEDWQLLFFGCFVNSSRKTDYRSVVKVTFRCCAHGYVINRPFAEQVVAMPWQNVPYDDMIRSLKPRNVYAVYPAFAYQSNSATDNDNRLGVDRARRIFGGLHRLQHWNEFSTRRMIPLILAHVALFFILVLILLLHYGLPWK